MNDRSRVIACFREAGFQMDKNRYEHRLIAQKMIWLLKLKGIPFEYPFGLYVRGPYSPALALEYYRYPSDFLEARSDVSLTSEESGYVSQVGELFGKSPSLLEIGATYGYLAYQAHYPPEVAYRLVKSMKSFYRNDQIVKGVNKAKQYLFTPADEDVMVLEGELRQWQWAGIRSMRH